MACEADVARRTRTDVMRHARPRGRACEAQAVRRWKEAMRVHVDTREGRHVARGGWQLEGPRVSGPWL